jgi:hypothetical protein
MDEWREAADVPGWPGSWSLAIDPQDSYRVAIAWSSWGWFWAQDHGNFWVRAMRPNGEWGTARTVNPEPVYKVMGGIQIAILPDRTIVAAFSDGSGIFLVESTDGEHWSHPSPIQGVTEGVPTPLPTPLPTDTAAPAATPSAAPTAPPTPTTAPPGAADLPGTLAVQHLESDPDGGLHLLFLGSDGSDSYYPSYAYRPPGGSAWFNRGRILPGKQIRSDLGVAKLADGRILRVIVTVSDHGDEVIILTSDDGQSWSKSLAPLNRWFPERANLPTVQVAPRGDTAIIIVTWQQYAAGGVFATVSTDGGTTWSAEERLAQHTEDAALYRGDEMQTVGWGPTTAYDPATDRVAAIWYEWPIAQGDHEKLARTWLSWREAGSPPLDGTWMAGVSPETAGRTHPIPLSPVGYRGRLFQRPGSGIAWVLAENARNRQYRLMVRRLQLSDYLEFFPG